MIPKIIHQIAPIDESRWHPVWKECQQSWKDNFPNFEYVLWNDENDLRNLVKDNYPQFLREYDSWPYHIMRIDFARFCILHKYGGIYTDMDIYCYQNFYHLLNPNDVYLLEAWRELGELVQNSIMISPENHDFWMECCEESIRGLDDILDISIRNDRQLFILNAFGPLFLTKMISEGIGILSKEFFNPKVLYQFNHSGGYQTDMFQTTLEYFNETNKNNEGVFTRHYLTGKW